MAVLLRRAVTRWGGGGEIAQSLIWALALVVLSMVLITPGIVSVINATYECEHLGLASPDAGSAAARGLKWMATWWYVLVPPPLLSWALVRLAFPRFGRHAGGFAWLAALAGVVAYQYHTLEVGMICQTPILAAATDALQRRLGESDAAAVRLHVNRIVSRRPGRIVDVTSPEQLDPDDRRNRAYFLVQVPSPREKGLAGWVLALAPEIRELHMDLDAFAMLRALSGEDHRSWAEWQSWYDSRRTDPEWAPMVLKKVVVEHD